ncbi:MmpS family transport accessory protein [Mycobacterium sp. MAA66]|uniref:MmpS family transport accessory protein n=1 Tax=Mycobacterium sp. MAA66 TaxID=3156297 RepID=UPI00351452CC
MSRLLKKVWIPLLLIAVLSVSGIVVSRLHKQFASEDLNANAGAGIEIVQFHPKYLVYDVYGTPGATAKVGYIDAEANLHNLDVTLPWSTTIETTLPSVMGNIVVQSPNGTEIGCTITVDGTVRDQKVQHGTTPQTFCLVKSA